MSCKLLSPTAPTAAAQTYDAPHDTAFLLQLGPRGYRISVALSSDATLANGPYWRSSDLRRSHNATEHQRHRLLLLQLGSVAHTYDVMVRQSYPDRTDAAQVYGAPTSHCSCKNSDMRHTIDTALVLGARWLLIT